MLLRMFTEHPASVGETYLQHLRRAAGVGTQMLVGGIACFIHGVLPFLFVRTGSRTIASLYEQVAAQSDKRTSTDDGAARRAEVAGRDLSVLS